MRKECCATGFFLSTEEKKGDMPLGHCTVLYAGFVGACGGASKRVLARWGVDVEFSWFCVRCEISRGYSMTYVLGLWLVVLGTHGRGGCCGYYWCWRVVVRCWLVLCGAERERETKEWDERRVGREGSFAKMRRNFWGV